MCNCTKRVECCGHEDAHMYKSLPWCMLFEISVRATARYIHRKGGKHPLWNTRKTTFNTAYRQERSRTITLFGILNFTGTSRELKNWLLCAQSPVAWCHISSTAMSNLRQASTEKQPSASLQIPFPTDTEHYLVYISLNRQREKQSKITTWRVFQLNKREEHQWAPSGSQHCLAQRIQNRANAP